MHYYFEYEEECDDHTYKHYLECESDEEARRRAKEFFCPYMSYLCLYTCTGEGEESDEDLCLYHAHYERKLCEASHTREEAEAELNED